MVKIIETYARDLREIDLNAPRDMTMHPRDGQSPKGLQLQLWSFSEVKESFAEEGSSEMSATAKDANVGLSAWSQL